MSQDQTGRRFSHVYLSGGEALPDSARARTRIGHLLQGIGPLPFELHDAFQRELGADMPWGAGGPLVQKFVQQCELRDFLDAITVVWSTFAQRDVGVRANWLRECRRIFSEERLRYIIDDGGRSGTGNAPRGRTHAGRLSDTSPGCGGPQGRRVRCGVSGNQPIPGRGRGLLAPVCGARI
jgi:hypothetical protein